MVALVQSDTGCSWKVVGKSPPFMLLPVVRTLPSGRSSRYGHGPLSSERRSPSCHAATTSTTSRAFERSSKRRKGFPSETRVKRGQRIVYGDKLLEEKLGRNDPCPCGSGKSFQEVLSERRTLLTVAKGTTTSGIEIGLGRSCCCVSAEEKQSV